MLQVRFPSHACIVVTLSLNSQIIAVEPALKQNVRPALHEVSGGYYNIQCYRNSTTPPAPPSYGRPTAA